MTLAASMSTSELALALLACAERKKRVGDAHVSGTRELISLPAAQQGSTLPLRWVCLA
jgi:hypothetical protein